MRLDIKIGDAVTSDTGTEWRIEGLPGISLAWPKDYLATTADGSEGMLSPSEITHINGEPVAAADWGGGLPPVGTLIEWLDGSLWIKVEVVGSYHGSVVAVDPKSPRDVYIGKKPQYRQYRTPEQIAADERESHVNGMLSHDALGGTRRGLAEALYDAGYRLHHPVG